MHVLMCRMQAGTPVKNAPQAVPEPPGSVRLAPQDRLRSGWEVFMLSYKVCCLAAGSCKRIRLC